MNSAASPSPAEPVPGEALLSVADLRLRIADRQPVDGVSFRIDRGETLVLLGESGSGKSLCALSLIDLLPNAVSFAGGQIVYAGQALQTSTASTRQRLRGRHIAMVFQEPMTALNPVLSIGYQLGEAVRLHKGLRGRALQQRCEELLEAVGIGAAVERLRDYPHQLSGGMKQRVMIAMALAGDPQLLIADEPTTALDVTIQAQILQLLRRLQRERGMALLLITHDLGVAAQMADRIAVMYAGQIVEQAPCASLFNTPVHPYTQLLFRARPDLRQRGQVLAAIPGATDRVPARGCRFAPRCDQAQAACRVETPAWVGTLEWGARCLLAGRSGSTETAAALAAAPVSDRSVSTAPLLRVHELSVAFPISRGFGRRTVQLQAVDAVSFELHAGRTLALVGESGCGKTTVAKTVLQLQRGHAGSIHFAGQELGLLSGETLRRARRGFQMVFQDPFASLNPRMRIRDMLLEAMQVQGVGADRTERLARALSLLEQVGLRAEQLDYYPHQFSGGQRQRLCIARALAVEPQLLVCDEPTSALDVSVQAQILNLLRRLQRERGLAYLFISHDIAVVSYLADDIAVMYLGRIVERGPAEQLLAQPRHPYTQALLAAVPGRDSALQATVATGDIPSPLSRPSGCHFHPRCPQATDACRSHYPDTYSVSAEHSVSCVLYRAVAAAANA